MPEVPQVATINRLALHKRFMTVCSSQGKRNTAAAAVAEGANVTFRRVMAELGS
jgi:hypothetical protein